MTQRGEAVALMKAEMNTDTIVKEEHGIAPSPNVS